MHSKMQIVLKIYLFLIFWSSEHPKKDLALTNNKVLKNCPNLKKYRPFKKKENGTQTKNLVEMWWNFPQESFFSQKVEEFLLSF